MIKKTIWLFLAMSFYLLSLPVLAQSNRVNESSEINNVPATTSVNKAVVEEAVSHDELTDKVAVDESLAAAPLKKVPLEQVPLEQVPLERKSVEQLSLGENAANSAPQVGKHVMANMNAGSMILSLLMVLGLIIVCGFVLKRFNLTQQSVSQLKLVTSLRLGTKERVIVVQVGQQQLLLGVTSQQITLLETLSEPLPQQGIKTADLSKNILSFLSAKKRNDN